MAVEPPLSQATGYGVVIGLGALFALGMILTTFVLKRYNNEVVTSEAFSTAGRSVKTGLVSSAVVSSWTWAATLLQSSAVAYEYGVSGPFWYAAGGTVQVILFATLAIELKRRAPNAHTMMEVVRARYGAITHAVFIVFGLFTNILVTAELLTGGSAVVTSLTGMPTAAACFLLPVGVVLYTMFGGIKATFLTDYAHTVIILAIVFTFAFTAYATHDVIGSPSRVYDLLVEASESHPVAGNADGSYLTMRSVNGGIFFIITIVGGFGTVFADNGYYNKAIAAGPIHALPGYVLGGLSWFAIPWLCATTMGLSALALESIPVFPTYPERMDPADVTAGLVLPYAATALLGTGGAVATLLLIFMAVTSAMSAELIAVSSICTYDIYKTYLNPDVSGKKLIAISHMAVVIFAVLIAGFGTGLYYAGISLGYLYLLMGVIVSSAVIPAALTLLWSRQSWAAATFSPVLGLACSLIGWLVMAKYEFGDLSVESTGSNYPMLVGNVVALLSPGVFTVILSFTFPSGKYDWASMRAIRKADDSDVVADAHVTLEILPGQRTRNEQLERERAEEEHLIKRARWARWLSVSMTIGLLVAWPMPMYGSSYVFSEDFFTGWVVISIIWLFCSAACVGVYPLWEGRGTCAKTFRLIWKDIRGQWKPSMAGKGPVAVEGVEVESSGQVTPGSGEMEIKQ